MICIPGLDKLDTINLLLTAHDKKPLSLIALNSDCYPDSQQNIDRLLTSDEIRQFKSLLEEHALTYHQGQLEKHIAPYEGDDGELSFDDLTGEVIAFNRNSLGFIISSQQSRIDAYNLITDPEGAGLNFGYPQELVTKYLELYAAKISPTQYYHEQMLRLRGERVYQAPAWTFYISFIPFLKENGDFPETAQKIGEEYRSFIRKLDKNFAERFEEESTEQLIQECVENQYRWIEPKWD